MLSLSSSVKFPPSLPKSTFSGVQIRHTYSFPLRVPTAETGSSFPGSSHSSPVVMMAKREEEMKEIRGMSTEQINEEVIDLKGDLLILRFQKSVRNEFKSSEFHRMRKRIARMLTVKREREIEEGINKRISRKLDRQWKKSIVVRPSPALIKLREEEAAKEAEKSE